MIGGHGGNIHELGRRLGCSPADITDLSSNVNPLGPPPGLQEFLREQLDAITRLKANLTSISTATKGVWQGLDTLRAGILAKVAEAEAELRAAG